jgi:hypothetical protein
MNTTRNFTLYVLILELLRNHREIECRDSYDRCCAIERDVIAADRGLVWC